MSAVVPDATAFFYGPGVSSAVTTGGMAMFEADEAYMDEMDVIDEMTRTDEMECLS